MAEQKRKEELLGNTATYSQLRGAGLEKLGVKQGHSSMASPQEPDFSLCSATGGEREKSRTRHLPPAKQPLECSEPASYPLLYMEEKRLFIAIAPSPPAPLFRPLSPQNVNSRGQSLRLVIVQHDTKQSRGNRRSQGLCLHGRDTHASGLELAVWTLVQGAT